MSRVNLRCVADACARVKVEARVDHAIATCTGANSLRASASQAAAQLHQVARHAQDEGWLCGQAVLALQTLAARAARKRAGAQTHTGAPDPQSQTQPRVPQGGELSPSTCAELQQGGSSYGSSALLLPRSPPDAPSAAAHPDALAPVAPTALELEHEAVEAALQLLRLLAVSSHGFGLSEAHAHSLALQDRPRDDHGGAVWALACEHVRPLVQYHAGAWSFPHACFAHGTRPVVLQGSAGSAEHTRLAEYFLCLIDPTFDSRYRGSDEPLALLAAPFHLLRDAATALHSPSLAQASRLLRSRDYAARLAGVPHMPPLPLLLLEALCRGHDGAPRHESVKLVQPEVANMIAACELPTDDARGEAVAAVLARIATRLELSQRAAEARAAQRREAQLLHRGVGVYERACSHIQRCLRRYVFAQRQRNADSERFQRFTAQQARLGQRKVLLV